MLQLTSRDHELIRAMRKEKVFRHTNPQLFDLQKALVASVCSDGDQSEDIHKDTEGWFRKAGFPPRFHAVKLNGGGLLLPESPLVEDLREDLVYLKHLREACEIKQTDQILIFGHAPCAVATNAGLTAYDIVEMLARGQERLVVEMPDYNIVCAVHVDYTSTNPNRQKKTYFLDTEKWRSLKEQFAQFDDAGHFSLNAAVA